MSLLPVLILHMCLLLPTLSLTQIITPAPNPDLRRRQQSITSPTSITSIPYWSALAICESAVPGCTQQTDLYEACNAEYNGDFKYLYCLCTTGYYDAVTACDACSVSLGIGSSLAFYSSQVSGYVSDCSKYATEYGGDVMGTWSGIMSVARASVTITGSGGGDESEGLVSMPSTSRTYPSSPIGVATRISSVGSDVPFGGLVSTGSEGSTDMATATATGSENRGSRGCGVQVEWVLIAAISVMFWAMLS
ncbi:MAG: hypothetical protein Q9225_001537 [Loekoesia sp. 1 TL-2023]